MALTVLTASAGSGKTAALVLDYLRLIIKQPSDFAHILALTFTNKAAAEMKERILSYLDSLSDQDSASPIPEFVMEALIRSNSLDEKEIRHRARKARQLILHQYEHFHVSTIDSFVHGIVRSFAFDLRLPQHFEIELEEVKLLDAAVTDLIQRAGIDKELSKALIDFARQNASDDKSWSIHSSLVKTAKKLFREDSYHYTELLAHKHPDSLIKAKDDLLRHCAIVEAKVVSLAQACYSMMQPWGPDYFSYKRSGVFGIVEQLAGGNKARILLGNSHFNKAAQSGELFPKSGRSSIPSGLSAIESDIALRVRELSDYLDGIRSSYALLSKAREHIYQVILLNEIQNHVKEQREERQTIHISEFNRRISKVVRKQPEPFIYERTGNRFRHLFIDEFQDTSVLQWFNLIPMMENALSNGGTGLIVGDPKQAIYRFRNGEPELFSALPDFPHIREFPEIRHQGSLMRSLMREVPLLTNYRSLEKIVEFNNAFFLHCKDALAESVEVAYKDLKQASVRKEAAGLVGILLLSDGLKSESDLRIQSEIHQLLSRLKDEGYAASDIAILFRDNSSVAETASFLIRNGHSVTSPESMLLSNSSQVRYLKDLLYLLNDSGNQIAAAGIAKHLSELGKLNTPLIDNLLSIKQQPLQGIKRLFKQAGIDLNLDSILSMGIYEACEQSLHALGVANHGDPFLLAFLDNILERTVKRNESLGEFIEWLNDHQSLSLLLPPDGNSIQVMTVHKSKGLQFPVVIYPISSSKHKNTKADAWVSIPDVDLPATLVNLSKDNPNEELQQLYETETRRTQLDELNTNYVAFTRAGNALFLISKGKEGPEAKNMHSWLHQFINNQGLVADYDRWIEYGELPHIKKTARREESQAATPHVVRKPWRDRLSVKVEASSPELRWGKITHLFLASLESQLTLERDLLRFSSYNHLQPEETLHLRQTAMRLMDHHDLQWLFSGEGIHRPEISLASETGHILRPDRVVFREKEAMLADFKTGEPSESHIQQIETYALTLNEAGFRVIKKVLIYLEPEILVRTIE